MSADQDHLPAAIQAESDRLYPRVVAQDAALSLAASAPRIAGHLQSAIAARNWWAVAGWSLRALDTALLEVGHLRHDVEDHRAAAEFWSHAHRAATEAVPDQHAQQERAAVLGRWARRAPGWAARRGTLLGAVIYVLGRGALRVQRRRASPTLQSVLPAPSPSRRASFALRAAAEDLVIYLHPAMPDRRGD